MMGGILSLPKKELDRERKHRKTIFKMKCTIGGKCRNLVIDGGSS
jgi:hypothetical protein